MNRFYFLVLVLLTFPAMAFAQDSVSSNPMGYVTLNVHSRTDNLLSVPLLQEPVAIGHVLAFTSNTISLDNSGWTTNQFAPANGVSYYAEISTGALAGLSYSIVSNTVDTLTLNLGTSDLTQITLGQLNVTSSIQATTGDVVRIRPVWTVGTVFGSGALTPFSIMPTISSVDLGDSLLFFSPSIYGINPYPTQRLFYVQSMGWRTLGDATTDQSGVTLPPLSAVVVRSQDTSPLNLVVLGDAYQSPATIWVPGGKNSQANDTFVALASSEPVSLDRSGLASAITPTTQTNQRQDVLLQTDPTQEGFERPYEQIFYYLSGSGWVQPGSSQVVGSALLDPTQGYVVRQKAASAGHYWRQNITP